MEAARYDWFGTRYGWLPWEVDGLPIVLVRRLEVAAAARQEIEREQERQ